MITIAFYVGTTTIEQAICDGTALGITVIPT